MADGKKKKGDGAVKPGMSTAELLDAGIQVVVPFELPPTGEGITYYDDGKPDPVPPDLFERGNAAWSRDAAGNEDSAAAAAASGDGAPAAPAKPDPKKPAGGGV